MTGLTKEALYTNSLEMKSMALKRVFKLKKIIRINFRVMKESIDLIGTMENVVMKKTTIKKVEI